MNYSITQHNKTDYSLFIKGNSKNILLESIIHLLPFAFIDEEELYFKAENVCSLQDFLKNLLPQVATWPENRISISQSSNKS